MTDATDAADSATPATAPTAGAVYDTLANDLSGRTSLWGKLLAGLATVATGAVGLKQVNDLAPRHGEDGHIWVASLFAVAALGVAAAGAIGVAVRLMAVDVPVYLDVGSPDVPRGSKKEVAAIYSSTAADFGFTSLSALQAKVRALREAATRASTDAEKARRTAQADDAQAAIDTALGRARWAVVRRRATKASSGLLSVAFYAMVGVGLLSYAYLSDIATGPQTDNIRVAKACGDARKAGALNGELASTVCSPTPAAATRKVLADQLSSLLEACQAAVPTATTSPAASPTPSPTTSANPPPSAADCTAIKAAVAALEKAQ